MYDQKLRVHKTEGKGGGKEHTMLTVYFYTYLQKEELCYPNLSFPHGWVKHNVSSQRRHREHLNAQKLFYTGKGLGDIDPTLGNYDHLLPGFLWKWNCPLVPLLPDQKKPIHCVHHTLVHCWYLLTALYVYFVNWVHCWFWICIWFLLLCNHHTIYCLPSWL